MNFTIKKQYQSVLSDVFGDFYDVSIDDTAKHTKFRVVNKVDSTKKMTIFMSSTPRSGLENTVSWLRQKAVRAKKQLEK